MSPPRVETLVVIPARGGSRRVPLKNIAPVAGRPALAHAVDALREATVPLACILLTDDARIAGLAGELGLNVMREPPELASDDAVDETRLMRLALDRMEPSKHPFRFVLLHYACVPVRPFGIVDRLVRCLDETGADFVQTASPVSPHYHPYRLVALEETGCMTEFVRNTAHIMSQDYPPLYFRTAAGVGMRRDAVSGPGAAAFFDPRQPLDRRCVIHAADECVDIDEPCDIAWAEFLLERRVRCPDAVSLGQSSPLAAL